MTRGKQTRSANRKRQTAPFNTGDLVYLSSQNISFKKGLARKLLPKFLGPYKISKDFGNSSFLLELPAHLKRRGLHNVFHLSLLRIHVPNDDRLFPGRMDTQLAGEEDGDEWAIDWILSHHGARTNATFEILWKSGDVTWLPYYQITHLQALTDYLELLRVPKIAKLPSGRGRPPQDDPQIFLGLISFDSPPNSIFSFLTSFFGDLVSTLTNTYHLFAFQLRSFFPPTSNIPSVDLEGDLHMPFSPSIKHPSFQRISATHYKARGEHDSFFTTIHVRQIVDYVDFDAHICKHQTLSGVESIPLGCLDFADLWNNGVPKDDAHRISNYFWEEDAEDPTFEFSLHPLMVADFFITKEQAGIMPPWPQLPAPHPRTDSYARELADILVERRRGIPPDSVPRNNNRPAFRQSGRFRKFDATQSRLHFARRAFLTLPLVTTAILPLLPILSMSICREPPPN